MKTAAEIWDAFEALPEDRRWSALAIGCRAHLLPQWDAWCQREHIFTYVDGVVGIRHTVDFALPRRALAEIERRLTGEVIDPAATFADYREPIVAMQDNDLELPEPITFAFYAIYNLHEIVFAQRHAPGEDIVLKQYLEALDRGQGPAALLQEWWTRVWDAWATTATP